MPKTKFLALAATLCLIGTAAEAQLNVGISIGQPAYVAPAPVVVGPPAYYGPVVSGYDEHHRRHDWEYWRNQRAHDEHWHR